MNRLLLLAIASFFSRHLLPIVPIAIIRLFWPLSLALYDIFLSARNIFITWRGRGCWLCPSSVVEYIQTDFEARAVPRKASHVGPFSRLLHYMFKRLHIVFLVNMVPGTGHNTVELDGFLRLKLLGLLEPGKRWVLVRPPSQFHDATVALYGHHFWFSSNSRTLSNVVSPILARYDDIRFNVGLSRLRWQLRDDGTWEIPPRGQSFLYQVSKEENLSNWQSYFKVRHNTKDKQPLTCGLDIDIDLRKFLNTQKPLALIHVKYHVANATAMPTDPKTYISAINYLLEHGYCVIMIGREQIPSEFISLGVINYANSSLATYRHDLQLVAHADVVITAGSGIALIPDCMNVPLVYLNSWHLGMPLASERCIIVPTLVSDRLTGRTLSIREQAELYWAMEDRGNEMFPSDRYVPRDASDDEILCAVKEALIPSLDNPLSRNQKRYFDCALHGNASCIDSRVSEYFINKHVNLLDV